MTTQNQNKSLSVIYPSVHKALQAVGHLSGDSKLPQLGKVLSNQEREQIEAEVRKDERSKDKRNTYLLTRWSGHWRKPIHKTMKNLKEKRGLGWLHVSMVYKRHNNLKEMLLGDIQQKCMMGIKTAEYVKKTRKKKCSCRHKVDGRCLYREECETAGAIYKITCKCCQDFMLERRKDP